MMDTFTLVLNIFGVACFAVAIFLLIQASAPNDSFGWLSPVGRQVAALSTAVFAALSWGVGIYLLFGISGVPGAITFFIGHLVGRAFAEWSRR